MSIVKAAIFTWAMAATPAVPSAPEVPPVQQRGEATTYGYGGLHGDTMANGQPFRPREQAICAHKELPLGTTVMIESASGRRIWCRIADRGPYVVQHTNGQIKPVTPAYIPSQRERWIRVLDLSIRSAVALGAPPDRGFIGPVKIRYWAPDRKPVNTIARIRP